MRVPFLLLLVLFALHCSRAPVAAQRGGGGGASPPKWNTLSGNRPLVIAKGGFSGMFPESSDLAYRLAGPISLSDLVLWCNVQITKDEVGICLPNLNMDNGTDIRYDGPAFKNRTSNVNGNAVTGWFASDYTLQQLANVTLSQGMFARPPNFDFLSAISTVDNLQSFNAQSIWLNVQNPLFYSQQKLNVTNVLLSASSKSNVGYISSPEVSFLQSVAPVFRRQATQLIFRFLNQDFIEPSSNQSYGSLLKNLTFVKTFASGILVPKYYIWPSNGDYLVEQPNTVVADARKAGLAVFVSDFTNDVVLPFNYSYNPVAEYLNYINLGSFSVDGFVSDFPASASEAIGCFSHMDGNTTTTGKPTIISHYGASGDYPGCTDLAYQNAVQVGADYIDCPVQFTKDGILICMASANLLTTTTVSNSPFGTRFSTFPEFQETNGIYSFNLTWDEIQKNMKPAISNPQFETYRMVRNPARKNDGKFMSLNDFLQFALDSSASSTLKGVVITIEYAAFFAEKLGFNVTDSVINTLNVAGFNNQTKLEVMIESTNSSTLIPFKVLTKHKILYKLDELISNTDAASLDDIKKFADAVAVNRQTIFPSSRAFVTGQTKLVNRFHSANISVYSYLFMNEFVNPPWDFFADPIIEIHNHVVGASVDGVITDFPGSASLYRRNTCQRENYAIPLVQPGLLISAMPPAALPPAQAPYPSLTESEVSEPPLPPALKPTNSPPSGTGTSASEQIPIRPSCMVIAISLALFLVAP